MMYPTPLKLGTDTNLRPVNLAAGCWKLKCAGFIRTGRVAGTLSPLFPAEMVPETIAILGSPRLNPTHFAFRPCGLQNEAVAGAHVVLATDAHGAILVVGKPSIQEERSESAAGA